MRCLSSFAGRNSTFSISRGLSPSSIGSIVSSIMSRIFAISDLHIDYPDNLKWVNNLSSKIYQQDVLLVAGDVTDSLPLLQSTLVTLTNKFHKVFFVPGNHELWIREKHEKLNGNSVKKFHRILTMCSNIGVSTSPEQVTTADGQSVWVVPLFSWYATPDEDPQDTLYVAGKYENHEVTTKMWRDNMLCVWPDSLALSRSKYFAELNRDRVKAYDGPVVSFSHFLPRRDLIRAEREDEGMVARERRLLRLAPKPTSLRQGSAEGFNFTRYAGCQVLEQQIREMGSDVHVFGHQHRNRDRVVDGVRYISHCLGNKREREEGWTWGLCQWKGPKQVWPQPSSPISQ